MPVRPDAEQEEVELGVVELLLVPRSGCFLPELALDAVHASGRALDPVEQRPLRHAVVRVLVLGRHTALVAPPELDLAPVRLELRGLLVCAFGCLPAGEHDVPPLARSPCEARGDDARELTLVFEDDELDVVHCSPAASSRLRSIAA